MPQMTQSVRVFGGPTDQGSKASMSPASQALGETVSTAGVSRRARGPRKNGNFSYHLRVTEASAGGAVTVTYSNLPDPDVTNDAHWFADAAPISHVLTGVATFGAVITGHHVEWIRYKVLPTGDSADVYLYHNAEGVEY